MPRTGQQPPAADIDERRWQSVLAHDAAADGSFVYSVATTGVYCRPSCAARRPLRRNVRFHATCADAEAAGFRPCRRCKPSAEGHRAENAAKIAAACRTIEEAETAPSLAALAHAAGMSRFHFHRLFKSVTGITPKSYATAVRDKRMREALRAAPTVTDAIYEAGFASSGRFYDGAARKLGMQPRQFCSGGPDMQIRFAIAQSSLGLTLVAATAKGICAIFLGEDPATLEEELRRRFPRAEITGDDAGLRGLLTRAIAAIEKPRKAAALPLDLQGTPFQQQVWAALRDIPPGETTTYGEIARRIGRPQAVRAVGAACGANPVAIAVPCHRVVGSSGKLTGYRWGVERKRSLIAREGK